MKHKKYHLIYFFSLLFFILSLLSTSSAQTSYLDSLDGKFALQFQISENFTLTNFQGAILSGKYQLGKRSAIRLGLSLYFDDSSFDREATFIDTLSLQSKAKTNSIGFTVNSQYIAYLVSTTDIGFYLGAGPAFSFGNSDATTEILDNSIDQKGTSSSDTYSIGLDGIAGVEWSFYKNMSLSAEYGIKFYYYHRTDKFEDEEIVDERTNESTKLTANYINFGITVYF
jgi:opacity protein-like surface antigen